MDSSIYRHMKVGIVHFKAFPEATQGTGPTVETLTRIAEDDFWTAVEVGWIKDPQVRARARKVLEASHLEVCYAMQPAMFSQKLNLNSLDRGERKRALNQAMNCLKEAYDLGARWVRVFSGKDPGPEQRGEAKKALVDSLCQIARANEDFGEEMGLTLKVFDRSIDKEFLLGPFAEVAEVVAEVRRDYPDFGVLADLSHFPLLGEKPAEVIPLVLDCLKAVHIGNCVFRDRKHPLYGDLQPRFGVPEGEIDMEDVRDYFRLLLDFGFFNEATRPVCSVEVRPLLAEETSELIIANAKRVIKEAWALA